jgi:aryl-alcohol dehydrogenase-like predicted oxidoreductase
MGCGLNQLSRIGFGCYRVGANSNAHRDALRHALVSGCNLVDTSSNYAGGQSERVVGAVLSEIDSGDVFVMTKAGYLQGDDLALLPDLVSGGVPEDEVVSISDDSRHCIHPDFLAVQIARSCARLSRDWIDGFLLHNPEYYFNGSSQDVSKEEYYRRIKNAFEFLEERVSKGLVRYYGVSSNTLALPSSAANATSVVELLRVAREVSLDHHFKLIQFPYNLIETDAAEPHHDGVSLIDLARLHSVTTFANRPLNAKTPQGPIRIATYDTETRELDETRDSTILDHSIALIHGRLRAHGSDDDPMDFGIVKFLSTYWMQMPNADAVEELFEGHFFPFLRHLYQGGPPVEDMYTYAKLYRYALMYSKKMMTSQGHLLRKSLSDRGLIAADGDRPLASLACEAYFKAGIDHVLVGMRSRGYVDGLKELFQPTSCSPALQQSPS